MPLSNPLSNNLRNKVKAFHYTLSQSIPSAFRSSQSEASWNPGITLCSRVRVCTIESINSSRVLSLATEGDLRTSLVEFELGAWLLCAGATPATWPAPCEWWDSGRGGSWCPTPPLLWPLRAWPFKPRPPLAMSCSLKLSLIMERTGAMVSRYLNSSILDGERLMLRR